MPSNLTDTLSAAIGNALAMDLHNVVGAHHIVRLVFEQVTVPKVAAGIAVE